jgi:starch synthase
MFPLVKTGGLADVAGALPGALAREGVEVRTLLPGYPAVLARLEGAEPVLELPDLFGGPARVLAGEAAGLRLLAIEAPHLYRRPGSPYLAPDGAEWSDNALRFAGLAFVAAALGQGAVPGFQPDLLHAHDWQAGLTGAYLRHGGGGDRHPPVVFTVHNLAFQGKFPPWLLPRLGLPEASFRPDGLEYYGTIGYLKAGLWYADRITTVSPTYAAEIQTPESGMGLDGLLRGRAGSVSGILNGLDEAVWDPSTDPLLPARFGADDVAGRAVNKAELQRRLGLREDPGAMLFGLVGRLAWQKGFDLVLDAAPMLAAEGAQLALLGAGEWELEARARAAAEAMPGRIGCTIGFSEELARLIYAGADCVIVPSRFEPCGLTQLCALRYGAPPIVARTGGLADTVIDTNEMALAAGVGTGFQFIPISAPALEVALRRAIGLWRDAPAAWRRIQQNGMRADLGWRRSAARYAELFRATVAARAG